MNFIFDVDWTLIWEKIVRKDYKEGFNFLMESWFNIYMWSWWGKDYARSIARFLNIEKLIKEFFSKTSFSVEHKFPGISLDDQNINISEQNIIIPNVVENNISLLSFLKNNLICQKNK